MRVGSQHNIRDILGNFERYSLAARINVSHTMSRTSGEKGVLAETLPTVEGAAAGTPHSIIAVQEELRGGGSARQHGQIPSPGKWRENVI